MSTSPKKVYKKTCKACKEKFVPEREMQTTCCYSCAIDYARYNQEKRAKAKKAEARRELKKFNNNDTTLLKKKVQDECNKYIRLRDSKEPCISCLYSGTGRQWHAGHYRPQGGNSALRYDERNIHKQCSICNTHKSGNLAEYRKNLIKKIGLESVEELEASHSIKKWTKDELDALMTKFKYKIKVIQERCRC